MKEPPLCYCECGHTNRVHREEEDGIPCQIIGCDCTQFFFSMVGVLGSLKLSRFAPIAADAKVVSREIVDGFLIEEYDNGVGAIAFVEEETSPEKLERLYGKLKP